MMRVMRYEVVVGNIGTVYSGSNERQAQKDYVEYVEQSKTNYGRAAGESVTFFKDGYAVKSSTWWGVLAAVKFPPTVSEVASLRAENERLKKQLRPSEPEAPPPPIETPPRRFSFQHT